MALEKKRSGGSLPKGAGAEESGGFSSEIERILHLVLANVEDLIAVVDLKGRRLYNSPSYKNLLSDPRDLRGTDSFGEIHPDDRAMVQRVFEETVSSGIGKRIEYRLTRKNGTVRTIESRGNAILDARGKPEKIVIVSRDITDRKLAEKERSLLYSAVEQIAEAIIVTSVDGTIQYVNPAFERMSGYARAEVYGKNPRILKSGVHSREFYHKLWTTLQRGEIWSGQITNKRKDGTLYEEEVVISPVRDGLGSTVNYFGVLRDVTREKEIQRHLFESQKMDSLAQLAGGMANDFNNVMNVIQGTFIVLEEKIDDSELRRVLSLAEKALQRGVNAAKDLGTFARRDEGKFSRIEIADVIGELRKALYRSIEKGISIESELEDGLPPLEADGEKLFQGMLTLCINARDAILALSDPGREGTITLRVVSVDGREVHRRFPEAIAERYLKVSIADNGIGMTDEVRQKIFEPFSGSEGQQERHGLGLAMTYAIVRSHRGFVEVESERGKGTTFAIYLPALYARAEEPARGAGASVRGGSETILVVEDEEVLRQLLEAILVSRGYRVILAADGDRGLALYRQHRRDIHAVLTDMALPKLSGRELFQKILEIDPAAKVIFTSGYVDPTLKSRLYVEGAGGFIPKPFRPEDVLRTVRAALDLGQ
jgi:two-component system cell cycle sensor histidine kinase/response regulator CckA